jgi:hypothetical protein
VDAHGRKNRNVKDCQDIFGKCIGRIQLERYASKSEVEDAGAPRSDIAENGIGICAGHGDAFSFSLDGVDRRGFGDDGCR